VDAEAALAEFRALAQDLDPAAISRSLGVPASIADSLGLEELAGVFADPPPGVDEVVALTRIFQYGEEKESDGRMRFERVIIDTAPTGHTLRLLQLPAFLDSLTGRLIKLRAKISSAVDAFRGMFGGTARSAEVSPLDRLEEIQTRLTRLTALIKDPTRTQFCVVTIPTQLALEETKRLLGSLQSEGVSVSTVVCNQVIAPNMGERYLATRSAGQRGVITRLQRSLPSGVQLVEVPYVDTEVTGIYGLRFFGSLAHPQDDSDSCSDPANSKPLTIFGGKGGVGR
jgi:arsenite-transporting ATPase